jgi:hypothetical protein
MKIAAAHFKLHISLEKICIAAVPVVVLMQVFQGKIAMYLFLVLWYSES